MARNTDLVLTALAPMIWGSSYYVATEMLPVNYPLTVAMLRALPVGLLLLLVSRQLPAGVWWFRIFLLGALNFSLFWWMLFIAAYRLPGGIAATVGAIQPLFVIFLAHFLLASRMHRIAVLSAITGLFGVALLVITPQASLDPFGLAAGFAGALSMALGTVLTRRWQAEVSLLTFTGWQLAAGGLLLLPAAIWFEPALPPLTPKNTFGFLYLGLIGAALTYALWFRGLARLEASTVSTLGFLSPVSAVFIGWLALDQGLSPLQLVAVALVFFSLWLSQNRYRQARVAARET